MPGSLGDMDIKIGADLNELLSKVDAAKAKINQLTESNQQLKAGIADLNSSLKLNEAELAKTAGALTKMVDSGKGATAEANNLRKSIAGLSANSADLNKKLTVAKTTLAETTTQIKIQNVAMKEAEVAGGGFAKGATKAYSALRSLANIIPGIGVGGLVALIAGPLIDALSDLLGLTDEVTDSTKENSKAVAEVKTQYDKFLDSLETVTKTMGEESAKVNILFGALSDSNIGLKDRKEAIDQLIKISPAYFGTLNSEKASYEQISKALADYNASLAKTAEIKALLPQFETMFQSVVKLNVELAQLKRFQGGGFGLPDEEFKAQAKEITDKIRGITNEIAVAKKDLAGIAGSSLDLEEILFGKPDKPDAKEKVVKAAKEVAKQYTETLQHALSELFAKGFKEPPDPFASLKKGSKSKISLTDGWDQSVKDAIESIKKLNAPFEAMFQRVLKAEEQFAKDFDSIMKNTVNDSLGNLGAAIGDAIGGGKDLGQAIFGSLLETLGAGIEQLGQAMITLGTAKVVIEKFKFAPGIATVLAGVATVALGAALRAAVHGFAEGGEVKGPGSGKSDSILARVSKGEYIIPADKVKLYGVPFFDALRKGGGPPSFDSFLGGKIPKFAGGGFISPSMSNLISGPIGGGQAINVVVTGKLAGNDIYISNQRTGLTRGRNS